MAGDAESSIDHLLSLETDTPILGEADLRVVINVIKRSDRKLGHFLEKKLKESGDPEEESNNPEEAFLRFQEIRDTLISEGLSYRVATYTVYCMMKMIDVAGTPGEDSSTAFSYEEFDKDPDLGKYIRGSVHPQSWWTMKGRKRPGHALHEFAVLRLNAENLREEYDLDSEGTAKAHECSNKPRSFAEFLVDILNRFLTDYTSLLLLRRELRPEQMMQFLTEAGLTSEEVEAAMNGPLLFLMRGWFQMQAKYHGSTITMSDLYEWADLTEAQIARVEDGQLLGTGELEFHRKADLWDPANIEMSRAKEWTLGLRKKWRTEEKKYVDHLQRHGAERIKYARDEEGSFELALGSAEIALYHSGLTPEERKLGEKLLEDELAKRQLREICDETEEVIRRVIRRRGTVSKMIGIVDEARSRIATDRSEKYQQLGKRWLEERLKWICF